MFNAKRTSGCRRRVISMTGRATMMVNPMLFSVDQIMFVGNGLNDLEDERGFAILIPCSLQSNGMMLVTSKRGSVGVPSTLYPHGGTDITTSIHRIAYPVNA